MKDLDTRDAVDAAFGEETAVLFKHNPTCPISAAAHSEMESFEGGAQAPVYKVDIMANRELSDYIGERTGITHESPQVILLKSGKPAYDAARFDVSAGALRDQLGLA